MIIHGAFVIYQTFFSADACLLEVFMYVVQIFCHKSYPGLQRKTVKMSSFKSHLIYLGLILHVPVYLRFLPLVNVMLFNAKQKFIVTHALVFRAK